MFGRQRQDPSPDREGQDGGDEDFAAAQLIGQGTPDEAADDCPDARGEQDKRRDAKREVPGYDDKRQHEADQKVIEELQHVSENRGHDDAQLMPSKLLLPLDVLEHRGILSLLSQCCLKVPQRAWLDKPCAAYATGRPAAYPLAPRLHRTGSPIAALPRSPESPRICLYGARRSRKAAAAFASNK